MGIRANGEEVQGISQEVTRRILRAATIEAHSRPGAYVTSDSVMRRAKISEAEELRQIAQYLQSRGWIAEADADYGIFVVTYAGIDEALSE